jgi:2',3'-cyclic-nucleotide 2'-phosphodiesterase/3'-nucleotidase/5'-nucleotidase
MRTSKKLLSLLIALTLVFTLLPAAALAADANTVTIDFLSTSDVHGQFYATDYTASATASGTYRQSMTRIATYVAAERAAYKNVFLCDAGDLVQGTPLTYYYAFNKADVEDPAMKTLRSMGYDMFVLGNHEFNYGLTILQRQLSYLTSADTKTEKSVDVSVANYLAAATNNEKTKDWATWNNYAPYQIYDYDGVKVAVIGIGNPDIAKWDGPANREGIYFAGALETYQHYEKEMKEKSDLIVVVTHCGLNNEGEDPIVDSVTGLVANTDSIDLVFSGHEHGLQVKELTNKAGKTVTVVQPGGKANGVGKAVVNYNKSTDTYTIDAKAVAMVENKKPVYEVNTALETVLKPYETAAWNDYMLQSIGKATGDFSAANLGTAPSAFMDLINTVQLWGTYDNTGLNTPNNKADDKMAQLSISAPLTSGDAANLIPTGDIKLGSLFQLYRYENWFYQVTMSGKELHQWLECSASKITLDANGKPTVSAGDLTYYDVIYGNGFSYKLDAGKAAGSRVVSMTYNGAEVKDTDTFTVVLNNYRFTGGGNYVKYVNEHGCDLSDLQSRVIYYTRDNMIQGEDNGQARNLLANYIRQNKTIAPTVTSTWSVVVGAPFTDLNPTDYYYDAVVALNKAGVIGGMTPTTFGAAGTLERGQFVTMLYRMAGSPAVTTGTAFTDVAATDYFASAVAWAAANKITSGTTATTFAPHGTVTREQAVTLLYNFAVYQKKDVSKTADLTAYTDVATVSAYATTAMSWAVGTGIVKGVTTTTLVPGASAVRGQAAAILYGYQTITK